jgi:hypothetical protein
MVFPLRRKGETLPERFNFLEILINSRNFILKYSFYMVDLFWKPISELLKGFGELIINWRIYMQIN